MRAGDMMSPDSPNTVRHARLFFFFQAEDGIRDYKVTGVQTCALPISRPPWRRRGGVRPSRLDDGRAGRAAEALLRRALAADARGEGRVVRPDSGQTPPDRKSVV